MKPFKYFFIGLTLLGIFLFAGGVAGSHGHLSSIGGLESIIMFGTPIIGIIGLISTIFMKDNILKDTIKSRVRSSKEFYNLLESLNRATEIIAKIKREQTIEFESAEKFAEQLRLTTARLQKAELVELQNLWLWFSPTGPWDKFVGEEGIQLGTKIYDLTETLKKMRN